MTLKHKKMSNLNILEQNVAENLQPFICKKCNKSYKARNSLWYHEKKCNKSLELNFASNDKLVEYLVKENSEFKNLILEALKNASVSNSNNIINNNSNNKSFNLQFFLNETCKDAMNITEFVNSIQLQLSDLEKVGELGYIEGISNIIVKNLNALDVTLRPVHCTDKKRETMYIKDEDKWEKEDENKAKLHKMVKKIANKNIGLISEFKELYPDWKKSTSKVSDQFNKIIIESMGGPGDNDFEKEEKIIKKVAKEVLIDSTFRKGGAKI
jgi:phage FluMu protein Com